MPSAAITNYECFEWKLTQSFYFIQRGYLEVRLGAEADECGSSLREFWRFYDWLHILTVIFALVSLVLEVRYIYKFSLMFQQIKQQYRSERKAKQLQYQDGLQRIHHKNLKQRQKLKKRNTMFVRKSTQLTPASPSPSPPGSPKSKSSAGLSASKTVVES